MTLLISINWPSLVTSWVVVQKIYSKMYFVSCPNTHRDVTYLVNHGMVKNIKTWISWERNVIFLRNKKILNLRLRWHILRSYCFAAEVTFKWSINKKLWIRWKRKICDENLFFRQYWIKFYKAFKNDICWCKTRS